MCRTPPRWRSTWQAANSVHPRDLLTRPISLPTARAIPVLHRKIAPALRAHFNFSFKTTGAETSPNWLNNVTRWMSRAVAWQRDPNDNAKIGVDAYDDNDNE